MALEIERKFLVVGGNWRGGAPGKICRQGYLYTGGNGVIRVRIMGDKAFLTIKSRTQGITRREYEYPIPTGDAVQMLSMLTQEGTNIIEKTRYEIVYEHHSWVVDEFSGDNRGLVVAEIELSAEDEKFEIPDWAGREVSDDPRYSNAALARNPYRNWKP